MILQTVGVLLNLTVQRNSEKESRVSLYFEALKKRQYLLMVKNKEADYLNSVLYCESSLDMKKILLPMSF